MAIETGAQNGHTDATADEFAELHPDDERKTMALAEIAIATSDGPSKVSGKRKAAIVGFAPTSIALAPYNHNAVDDPEHGFELFGLNELYAVPGVPDTKFSLWIDIHDRRDGDFSHRDAKNLEWLAKQTFPIFMQEHYPDIPTSVAYPLHDAIRFYRTTYWTNSISFMLGWLGMQGRDAQGRIVDEAKAYGEVHVYGVDMAQEDKTFGTAEYTWQRPSCEYMIGFLRGMGIKVYVPRQSDLLLTPFIYGYQGDGQAIRTKMQARRAQLQNQANAFKGQAQTHLLNAAATEGAAKAFQNLAEELVKNGKCTPDVGAELVAHSKTLLGQAEALRAQSNNATIQAAGMEGAFENIAYTERALTGS